MADKPNVAPPADETPKQRSCGTMQVHERLLRTNADYVRNRIASENFHHEFITSRDAQGRLGVTTIPVVVHVVHNTAQQNISDAQIKSQIDVLNRDYRKKNADVSSIPAVFKPLAADARIEFVLATKDPGGNPTTGITRTQTNATGFSDDDKVKSAATGGADAWPADKYLNLWVCQLSGGLLGYAQFPGGPAATDGVVILHTGFGTSGTAAAPFNLGRTATHEVGHWLNLRHIWGDDGNGCNGSDFVADTPNCANHNFGKPAFPHVTCNNGPNGDMFMNYMDYTDDAAMFMFTKGQVTRIQACLDGDRSTIGTTTLVTGLAADVGPTLISADVHPTLASADVHPTLVVADVQPTLASADVHPTLASVDVHPTLISVDVQPTLKFGDDVKQPGLEKPPFADQPKSPASDQPGFPQGGGMPGPQLPGRAAPFVLSTPHHSMAWTQTFPQAAQAAVSAYEQQLLQYEQTLTAYAQAEAAGRLGDLDRQQGDRLYNEYQMLVAEYRQYVGG